MKLSLFAAIALSLLCGCPPGQFYPGSALDSDGDGVLPAEGDCDDANAEVAASLPEVCDGLDNDCDGLIDGADPDLADDDGDGFDDCSDCDDTQATVFPTAPEVCDGLDNNCDDVIPPGELDGDADGASACEGDCDDGDAAIGMGAPELCDGDDNDCDGFVDEPTASELAPRVAVAGPGGDLRVWSVVDGGLQDPQGLDVPVPGGVVGAVVPGDVDGDGVDEWFRQQIDPSDDTADDVQVVGRLCGGEWSNPETHPVVLGGASVLIAAGDLDLDGVGDVASLVLSGANAGDVTVQLGTNAGTYLVRPVTVTIPAVASGARWAALPRLQDLNADGLPDLLVCSEEPAGPRCRLHAGRGDGGFFAGVVRAMPPVISWSVDVGDPDGDGILDLFVGPDGDDGGRVYALPGDGTGRFGEPLLIAELGTEPGTGDGVLAAIEGEGTLALLWDPGVQSADRELALLRWDGTEWSVGASAQFTAAASAPGLRQPLVASP